MNAYLAVPGFLDELKVELEGYIDSVYGELVLAEPPPHAVYWVSNIWFNAQIIPIESISDAAKKLRAMGALWAHYPFENIRRAKLIEEKLPQLRPRALVFLEQKNLPPLGSWTLIETNKMIASAECQSHFPNGDVQFQENKEDAPSRAYLKLWEVFTIYGVKPRAGEKVLDMGSCPGGWTWVLHSMGCHVTSVDRSELDPRVMKLKNVRFIAHNAFTIEPSVIGPIDWFFSDIICEPHKLYELVQKWMSLGLCEKFICTIKMKGRADFKTTRLFAAIPGSRVVHLNHNKHELTWIRA